MSASAWIYQDHRQLQEKGPEGASWFVGWYNLDGKKRSKSFGPGDFGKLKAEKFRRKTEADLDAGAYREQLKKAWPDFRQEYESRIMAGLAVRSRDQADVALDHFERIVKPARVFTISTRNIDAFIAERRQEGGKKVKELKQVGGAVVKIREPISPASVNSDLRHIKAALRVAHEWGYLPRVPKFRMEKVPKKLATYITGDNFALIYAACDRAKFPLDQPFPAADWWRGLMVMGYMTGWRISDMLGLRRQDLDLDAGYAITRAEDNKGKRDERVKLHAVVVEHLRRLAGFDPRVFPWNHDRRTLQTEFAKIQEKAGIHLPCQGEHEHTRYCHVYGFHDLRRAFATMNADKLTPDALQTLMRHKSYQTTQVYINMARQMDHAVASLHVPDVLKAVN